MIKRIQKKRNKFIHDLANKGLTARQIVEEVAKHYPRISKPRVKQILAMM